MQFKLYSKYKPSGDQPKAIKLLTAGLRAGINHQTLLGVTGSGKTFTIASVIKNVKLPTLIISHNKTLAAQLYSEFKQFFPNNAICYFVSYYDYYQPEAYIPRRDIYIEKEVDINKDIERYRNQAVQSILTRKDVIIISSVSCIYGIGNKSDYISLSRSFKVGNFYNRNEILQSLSDMQYERSEYEFSNGMYRIRGDTIDIFTSYNDKAVRLEFFNEELESIKVINPLNGELIEKLDNVTIFPAKQFVTPYDTLKEAIPKIKRELSSRIKYFVRKKKHIEANRIKQRVNYDIEMLLETGYCSGIENYSRYIDNRKKGEPPTTLIDYFENDWLLVIDESHITIPQLRGMYNGDKSRKEVLVEYGFRLPSSLDNRPLRFEEFNKKIRNVIYTSATPGKYEIEKSKQSANKIMSYMK